MEDAALMEALLELAGEVGLEVRVVRAGEEASSSALCRVRGAWWVVLCNGDPPAVQLDVLAGALARVAGPALEARFLPPAVRARIDRAAPAGA